MTPFVVVFLLTKSCETVKEKKVLKCKTTKAIVQDPLSCFDQHKSLQPECNTALRNDTIILMRLLGDDRVFVITFNVTIIIKITIHTEIQPFEKGYKIMTKMLTITMIKNDYNYDDDNNNIIKIKKQ